MLVFKDKEKVSLLITKQKEGLYGMILSRLNSIIYPYNIITNYKSKKTFNYILNDYSINFDKNVRKDYILRTVIIIKEKYKLNGKLKFIDYSFKFI